jgi:phage terminase large subunit GpA-like protein
MDAMSPYSPVQFLVVLKPRKVGMSTIIENCVAYYISEVPAEQLYTTANEKLAKDWSDKKLPPLIDSMGIRHLITASMSNAKSRRTGDTTERKEYPGGSLDVMSSQSKQAQRALDKRCLWIDEVDGLDPLTATGEGLWTEILFGHTASWNARKKIALFSSPSTLEASLIWKYYLEGDCRVFKIPCPFCGEHIPLEMPEEEKTCGLKPVTKGGKLIEAVYLCPACGEPIENGHKEIFYSAEPYALKNRKKKPRPAFWEPARTIDDPTYRSYSLNALYSPLGMVTFTDVYKAKAKAEDGGPDAMRSYVNIYAGLPYRDEGSRPKLAAVLALRGRYHQWTVPGGVIFLTAGIDVQRGSKKDERNPPRIEVTVLGTGKGYRGWLIGHRVFLGETTDSFGGAWQEFYEWLKKTNFVFARADGYPFDPKLIFIDAGDAADDRTTEICRFCSRLPPGSAFPIKGFSNLKVRKKEKNDLPGGNKRFRPSNMGPNDEIMFELNTNHYKSQLYMALNTPRRAEEPQKPGFIDFPMEMSEEYFQQLTGAEKLVDGTFRDARNRVEALDCMVYSLASADVFLDSQTQALKRMREAAGVPPIEVAQTNRLMVLDYIERNGPIVWGMTMPKSRRA